MASPSKSIRQVTHETSAEDYPHLSPDGKTLLVQSDRGGTLAVWLMDSNGVALSQLTAGQSMYPMARWSPDGNRFVYLKERNDSLALLIHDLKRNVEKQILITRYYLWPSWSPDGKKIAFTLAGSEPSRGIWVYNMESDKSVLLSALSAFAEFPSWSPDGKFITFNVEKENKRDIWIVSSETGIGRKITLGSGEYSHPQWSPIDEDTILCALDHKNLCLVSVRTGRATLLTQYNEANSFIDYPSWSFDGKKIYYSRTKKVGDIYQLRFR